MNAWTDRWEGGEKIGKKGWEEGDKEGRSGEEREKKKRKGWMGARKSEILDKHCGALVYLCHFLEEITVAPLVRKVSSALSSLCNVGGWGKRRQ